MIEVTGFVSDERLSELYSQARVVICPLLYGAGVKGKVVEAMRFGVPLVTTSVGAQGLTNDPEILKIADEPELFSHLIQSLISDDEMWLRTSLNQLNYVKKNFSNEAIQQVLQQCIKGK